MTGRCPFGRRSPCLHRTATLPTCKRSPGSRSVGCDVIELAVIDLAGTLVRDDGAVEGAFLEALRAVDEIGDGAPDDALRETVRGTMGRSKIAVFRELVGDEQRAQAANRAFEEAYARRIAEGETTALPTAHDALHQLRDAGVLVAVTTGFSAETRDALLANLGWADLVDLALSPTTELRGRPAPDLVLGALLRLGVDDVRFVAVAGDTTNDLFSGHRAGARVIAGILGGAHSRTELALAPHTHILDSVGEFAEIVVATRPQALQPVELS
jgi:phosphoglycolate phosphatase